MIDPWPRLLRAASELPLDTTAAAIAALSPDADVALDALKQVQAGRRTIESVLKQFGISRSEAQNRGKVLCYLSRDLGLLREIERGQYVATTYGGGVGAAGSPSAVRARNAGRRVPWSRRIRSSTEVAEPAAEYRGKRAVEIDLDVLAERTGEHQRIVRACADKYIAAGCVVHIGNFDLLALCGDDDADLVEAKSLTEFSERSQLKAAIGQLFTYEVQDAAPLIEGRRVRKFVAGNADLSELGRQLLEALGIEYRRY